MQPNDWVLQRWIDAQRQTHAPPRPELIQLTPKPAPTQQHRRTVIDLLDFEAEDPLDALRALLFQHSDNDNNQQQPNE